MAIDIEKPASSKGLFFIMISFFLVIDKRNDCSTQFARIPWNQQAVSITFKNFPG
jgi:hypothetical protein